VPDPTFDEVVKEITKLDPKLLTQLDTLLELLDPEVVTINKQTVDDVVAQIDSELSEGVNRVLYHPEFRRLEGVWRSISDLESATDFGKNIVLGVWHVTKSEVNDDIRANRG